MADATRPDPQTPVAWLIRRALPDDVPGLAALAARTWSEAFADGISPDDVAAELDETRSEAYFAAALRSPGRTVLVAVCDGRLAGYVQFGAVTISGMGVTSADRGLQRLYVDTPLQGSGLGRRLLEAALGDPELARAPRVFLQVWEQNARAVALYKRAGFRRVGTTRFTVGAESLEDLVMVRVS